MLGHVGARYLWPETGATLALRTVAHPVVPEGARPLLAYLDPEAARHHPAEAGEEVRAMHELAIARVDQLRLAVVVPRRDAEERLVFEEHPLHRLKVVEEVVGHEQIVLGDDHRLKAVPHEHLLESPLVVARYLVVAA